MDAKKAQAIVLKCLSESAPNELNLWEIFKEYGIDMTIKDFARFINYELIRPGFANMGTSPDHFSATEKGIQFGKSVTLELAPKKGDELSKIIFSFKPYNWAEASKVLCEPILGEKSHYSDLPIIVYGYDTPKTFLPIMMSGLKISKEVAQRESKKNLENEQSDIETYEKDGFKMLVCFGNHYTSEKILDINFMKNLQKQLETDILAVSIPHKGRMYVANGNPSALESIAKFFSITQMFYKKSEEKDRLSSRLFAVKDGQLLGLIELDNPNQNIEEKAEKKSKTPGFLKRLFGKI